MGRVNSLLLAAIVACALGVITSQHKARKVFNDLEVEQGIAQKLGEEFTQLQLEQGTWATHQRVATEAARQLGMRMPDGSNTVIVTPEGEAVSRGTTIAPQPRSPRR
jgi:cell division protein FtsL